MHFSVHCSLNKKKLCHGISTTTKDCMRELSVLILNSYNIKCYLKYKLRGWTYTQGCLKREGRNHGYEGCWELDLVMGRCNVFFFFLVAFTFSRMNRIVSTAESERGICRLLTEKRSHKNITRKF